MSAIEQELHGIFLPRRENNNLNSPSQRVDEQLKFLVEKFAVDYELYRIELKVYDCLMKTSTKT